MTSLGNAKASGDLDYVRTTRRDGWDEIQWRSLFFVDHSAGDADDELISQMLSDLERFSRRHDHFAYVLITGHRVKPPSAKGRAIFGDFMKAKQGHLDCATIWIRAEGIVGSVIRSVTTSIFTLGVRWMPSHLVANREELSAWVRSYSGATAEETETIVSLFDR